MCSSIGLISAHLAVGVHLVTDRLAGLSELINGIGNVEMQL